MCHSHETFFKQSMLRVQDVAKDPPVVKDGQAFFPMAKQNKKIRKNDFAFFLQASSFNGDS